LRDSAAPLKQQEQLLSASALTPPEETAEDSPTFTNQLSEWFVAGEAYRIASSRGLEKSQVTFRRWLADLIATGRMPPELERLGLVADLDTRRKANPKDNSVRWLRFED